MALPPKCDQQPYRLPAISQKAKETLLPQGICAVPVSCSGFPARTRNPIVHSKRTALSRTPRIPQNGRQNERAGTNPESPNKQCSRGNQRRVLRAASRELRASFSVQCPLSPRDVNSPQPFFN